MRPCLPPPSMAPMRNRRARARERVRKLLYTGADTMGAALPTAGGSARWVAIRRAAPAHAGVMHMQAKSACATTVRAAQRIATARAGRLAQ
jgi:hypothetical protein